MGVFRKFSRSLDGSLGAFRLLAPFVRRRRKAYLGLLLLVPFEIGTTLAFARFLGLTADVAVRQQFGRLYGLAAAGIGLGLLTIVCDLVKNRLEFSATNGVKRELSERLLRHILLLPASRTNCLHTGELAAHFNRDVHGIGGLLGSNLVQWVRLPLVFVSVLVYLMHIHLMMAVLGALVVPFTLVAGGVLGFVLRRKARAIHDRYGNLNRLLTETLQGLPVIRAFLAERSWLAKYRDRYGELYELHRGYAALQGWIRAGSQTAGACVFMISLCLGAYFVSAGDISVGSLLVFVNLSGHLLYPLMGLAGLWLGVQESSAAADRIAALLREPVEGPELPEPAAVPGRVGPPTVEFREVRFRYEPQLPLIEGLSLKVEAGRTVAVVGASGAGKSTLLHLLQRFCVPQSGAILLNGVPIDGMTPTQLRSYMALVAQETFLFAGSIRDNLLVARPDASLRELEQAAMQASIHDLIMTLPNGYDTEVGERGLVLSGGQRQRIAIARALLRDAPILLLDEATASLDGETEFQVRQSLDRLSERRTTIVVAHRLSTVRNADRIVVLEGGRIIQSGTHEELVSLPGPYRNLYRRQHAEKEDTHDPEPAARRLQRRRTVPERS